MPTHRRVPLLLIAILVLAAGLRFYRIDAQSLWNDEGNSARIAERSVAKIIEGSAGDIHPPLYYLTLKVWRDVFGRSEAALRSLSAVFGVVAVAFVYLLGRRLFEARVGLLAALLAAVNPFQVYYSQEARMYMMLTAIGVVATYILVRLLDFWSLRPRIHVTHRRYYVLYVALMAAGLYTHYAFPFLFVAHFGIVLAWSWYRPGQRLARLVSWLPLAAAPAALFIPWLPIAVRQVTAWPAQVAPVGAGQALLNTYQYYLLGSTIPFDQSASALVIAGFFLLMSAWTPDAFDEPEPDWDTTAPRALRFGAVAIYLLLPVALIFAFGLLNDAYHKFLLIGAPAFCLLLARGIDNGWQIARGALSMPRELSGPSRWAFSWMALMAVLTALLAAPAGVSLANMYFDPAYARDDYRDIARNLEARWRSGDAVLLHAANQWEVFTYYFPDGPDVFPLVKQRPLDEAATRRELSAIAAGHRRLFVLYWGADQPDPTRFVASWLDRHAYKAAVQAYGNVQLATYAVPAEVADTPARPTDVRFGDHIWLDGYTLSTPVVAPGDIVQVALFWRCDAKIAKRYKVFVHFLDANGKLVAQTDREPGGDLAPTDTWIPNRRLVDHYGVLLATDLPAGNYQISVGMYGFDDARLPVFARGEPDGDALPLAEVTVRP